SRVTAPISVDLPAPGGPVKPNTAAWPVCGYTSRTSSQPSARSSSTGKTAAASARRSPASSRCASVWPLIGRQSSQGHRRAIRFLVMEPLLVDDAAARATAAEQGAGVGAPERDIRRAPAPLHGGPLALLRFMRANHMLRL